MMTATYITLLKRAFKLLDRWKYAYVYYERDAGGLGVILGDEGIGKRDREDDVELTGYCHAWLSSILISNNTDDG